MRLTPAQLDRACGAVLGTAVGDALGAPYEFGVASVADDGPQMIGGGLGGFGPGEWTDDTSMAWAVLDVAATGADLRTPGALTKIAQNFRTWYDGGPADIGNQTRAVLSAGGPAPTGAVLTEAAAALHRRTDHTAGNGSLMRTAPVAVAHLSDPAALVEAARAVSALTHPDPHAQEACALWCLAIRHAVLEGSLDVRPGLEHLDADARAFWAARLDEAEQRDPATFVPNGWVVTALQAAWSAITHVPTFVPGRSNHLLTSGLDAAVRIGDDTDTVAAIAGALLGASHGASAFPAHWRRPLHGYPGLSGERLVELAHLAASGGVPGVYGWPSVDRVDYSGYALPGVLVRHPYDEGVWLGDAAALDALPEEVTAVVSLCLVGPSQVPADVVGVRFRLINHPDPAVNPHLEMVLTDVAATIASLRAEGHVVLVHCVAAQSRTPTAAIAYAVLELDVPLTEATAAVLAVLPGARPNTGFLDALTALVSPRE